jgi:hypothetical protein
MTSSERVARYIERQRTAGRKPVVIYLHPDIIAKLAQLARGRPRGEIVERAVAELWRVSNSGGSVT